MFIVIHCLLEPRGFRTRYGDSGRNSADFDDNGSVTLDDMSAVDQAEVSSVTSMDRGKCQHLNIYHPHQIIAFPFLL